MGYITYPRTAGRGNDEKKALEVIRLIENLLNGSIDASFFEIQYLLSLIDWSKLSVATRLKLLRLLNLLLMQQDGISRKLFLQNRKEVGWKYGEQSWAKLLEVVAKKISADDKRSNDGNFKFSNEVSAGILDINHVFTYLRRPINIFYSHSLKVLYRAMSYQEYGKIILTGQWSITPETMEGKWFAESFHAAKVWGNEIKNSTGSFVVVKVAIHASIINEMHYENDLDAKAPARFAQLDWLNKYAKIIKMYEVKVEQYKISHVCFLVILEWLPRQDGGRVTNPTSIYYCTTTVIFKNNSLTCSIRIDIDLIDNNKGYLHFFFEEFNSMIELNDRIILLEGACQVGYATIIDICFTGAAVGKDFETPW